MAGEESIVSGMSDRYALALFELARDDKRLDEVAGDLKKIGELLDGSDDLARLVRSPVFGKDLQAKSMDAILSRVGVADLTKNFVGVLIENRRLFALPEIIRGFNGLLAHHRGEISVQVTTAIALNSDQSSKLESALKNAYGRSVQLNETVDPSILGGLIVKVGSRMIDSSISTQLNSLQIAMREA